MARVVQFDHDKNIFDWKIFLMSTTLIKQKNRSTQIRTWIVYDLQKTAQGTFNNYVDKMRGRGGQKMSVFVHAQGIKTVHAKWQNSVHVVVECPVRDFDIY